MKKRNHVTAFYTNHSGLSCQPVMSLFIQENLLLFLNGISTIKRHPEFFCDLFGLTIIILLATGHIS